jgi:hypothetical protein
MAPKGLKYVKKTGVLHGRKQLINVIGDSFRGNRPMITTVSGAEAYAMLNRNYAVHNYRKHMRAPPVAT